MKPNTFVQLNRQFVDGKTVIDIKDLGDSNEVIRQKRYLRNPVRTHQMDGTADNVWRGWLGKYDAALARVATETHPNRFQEVQAHKPGRGRD